MTPRRPLSQLVAHDVLPDPEIVGVTADSRKAAPGVLGTEAIKWNFTKFLVDRHGAVVARYAPTDKPESLEKDIAPLLV